MTDPSRPTACRRCGSVHTLDELDSHGWCGPCRARTIRHATWVARTVAILVTVAAGAAIAIFVQPTRFVAGWMALLAGIFYVVSKVVRRVVFELRLRGGGRVWRRGGNDAPH